MKHLYNKLGLFAAVAIMAVTAGAAHAEAVDPSVAISGIATSASTLLSTVYPIVIGVVAFGVLISMIKLLKKK